jgi:serine/threonine-protein kinase
MKALGLPMDKLESIAYPGMKHPRDEFPVRSGPGATLNLRGRDWGKLPDGTVFSGVLFVGSRVYGRFTQAYTPEGHIYPVCLELYDALKDDKRGVFRRDDGKSDTARINGVVSLKPVEQFE